MKTAGLFLIVAVAAVAAHPYHGVHHGPRFGALYGEHRSAENTPNASVDQGSQSHSASVSVSSSAPEHFNPAAGGVVASIAAESVPVASGASHVANAEGSNGAVAAVSTSVAPGQGEAQQQVANVGAQVVEAQKPAPENAAENHANNGDIASAGAIVATVTNGEANGNGVPVQASSSNQENANAAGHNNKENVAGVPSEQPQHVANSEPPVVVPALSVTTIAVQNENIAAPVPVPQNLVPEVSNGNVGSAAVPVASEAPAAVSGQHLEVPSNHKVEENAGSQGNPNAPVIVQQNNEVFAPPSNARVHGHAGSGHRKH